MVAQAKLGIQQKLDLENAFHIVFPYFSHSFLKRQKVI